MKFESVIGLEMHVQMKTKSKMFSDASVSFGEKANTNVAYLDMAFPGSMPTVNKQAVINAIRVCYALHMDIDNQLWFDRKNYFYSDIAKGYQITQYFRPIGKNGFLIIKTKDGERRINVERLHIEEDAAKQIHYKDYSLIDYNRAGIPLLEIVSKHEIRNGEEARKYAEKIRSIVTFLDVSDGKMEEGSLRCDVNISLKPIGDDKLGNKVEIKNLNSFVNIQKAIDYEIERQEKILVSGGVVKQETRRFDEATKKTVAMRNKTDEVDYKYFVESNLVPINLSDEFIKEAIITSNELADAKLVRYQKLGLNEYDSNLLVSNKEISNYYDSVILNGANPKRAANWIIVDVQSVLKRQNISIDEFRISPKYLAKLINIIEKGTISNRQGRKIFEKMLAENKDPQLIIDEAGIFVNSDESSLKATIVEVVDANPQAVEEYKKGRDRAVGFLVGQIMKKTKGTANPMLTNKLIVEELKRR